MTYEAGRRMKSRPESPRKTRGTVWLFAYGSLLWEPSLTRFCHHPALLRGYHRALCIYSYVYRGTKARPGIVLGLDRGGSCRGMVIELKGAAGKAALRKIIARENVTDVYRQRIVNADLLAGRRRRVRALTFVADREHGQYAGKLAPRTILKLLRQGKGKKGRAADYLRETVARLEALGIRDRVLERIGRLVKQPGA